MLSRIVLKCVRLSPCKTSSNLIPTLCSGYSQRHSSHEKQKYRWAHKYPHHIDKPEQMVREEEPEKPPEPDTVMDFNISPVGYEYDSLATFVAIAAREVKRSGLPHQIYPMGTVVEGSLDQVFEVLKQSVDKSLRKAPRVEVNMKADVRPGFENRLARKAARIATVLEVGEVDSEVREVIQPLISDKELV